MRALRQKISNPGVNIEARDLRQNQYKPSTLNPREPPILNPKPKHPKSLFCCSRKPRQGPGTCGREPENDARAVGLRV